MSNISIDLIECQSTVAWDQFIISSPQCNPFSLSPFLQALSVPYKTYFAIKNNSILASVLILQPDNLEFFAPYPYSLYQGIAFAHTSSNLASHISHNLRLTQSIVNSLNRLHPRHSLCLHHSLSDIRAFQWYNYDSPSPSRYSVKIEYTGVLSLSNFSSFSDYLSSIRSSRLQDYKKASKSGFTVSCRHHLNDFIQLYKLTFSRQGINLPESRLSFIYNLVQSLLNCGAAKMISAVDHRGCICSCIVILTDPTCDYYHFSASDPEYRAFGLNTYLLLEAIKSSFLNSKKYFDMVGINSPNRGDFKTSFNALPKPFFSLTIDNICN